MSARRRPPDRDRMPDRFVALKLDLTFEEFKALKEIFEYAGTSGRHQLSHIEVERMTLWGRIEAQVNRR